MSGPEEQLVEGAAAILGEPLTASQLEAFRIYLDLLEQWNRVQRLVGSPDRGWMVRNVLLDSLLFLRVLPRSFGSVLDVGSGAGVPGIPIKIARPAASLVMVESRRRRASFLRSGIRSIGLTGAQVIHGRAEVLIGGEARFDVVVARCAGAAGPLLDLGSRLVTEGGMIVLAGGPTGGAIPGAQAMSVTNPATGSARTFVVRSGAGRSRLAGPGEARPDGE